MADVVEVVVPATPEDTVAGVADPAVPAVLSVALPASNVKAPSPTTVEASTAPRRLFPLRLAGTDGRGPVAPDRVGSSRSGGSVGGVVFIGPVSTTDLRPTRDHAEGSLRAEASRTQEP